MQEAMRRTAIEHFDFLTPLPEFQRSKAKIWLKKG